MGLKGLKTSINTRLSLKDSWRRMSGPTSIERGAFPKSIVIDNGELVLKI